MNKGLMSMHAGIEEELYAAPSLPNIIVDEMDDNIPQNGEASLVFKPISQLTKKKILPKKYSPMVI